MGRPTESNVSNMTKTTTSTLAFSGICNTGSSLALALQNSRRSNKLRTSFVRSQSSQSGNSSSDVVCSSFSKSVAFNHVVFHSMSESQSQLSKSQHHPQNSNLGGNSSLPANTNRSDSFTSTKKKSCMASLFEQSVVKGFHKRKRT